MINNVSLTGRLVSNPDLKYAQNETTVVNFRLAVERNFKNKDGEKEADFINCVAFRKTAELIGQYVKKGSLIGVEGRIQTRNYENNDGKNVYVTEIVVNNISFLSRKNTETNSTVDENKLDPFPVGDNDLPF